MVAVVVVFVAVVVALQLASRSNWRGQTVGISLIVSAISSLVFPKRIQLSQQRETLSSARSRRRLM